LRNILTVWRKEFTGYFLSPVAYVTMVVFLAMSGWVFLQLVEGHVGTGETLSTLLFKVIMFFWLPVLVTLVTMRLIAEEKKSGTFETLMTAPVTEAAVILGKYLAALTFLLVVALPALSTVFIMGFLSPGIKYLDVGALLGGCMILFLVSAFYISVGLIISLLTRSQIVAGACCFCAVLFLLLGGYLFSFLPAGSEKLAEYFSSQTHILDFSRGSVDTRPMVLYLSGTFLALFTAVRVLEWAQRH